jgi:hypothetical protein
MASDRRRSTDTAEGYYKSIPALRAYIERIGAVELNFRRYMVKEYKSHYYTQKCMINLAADGAIRVSDQYYAPTKDEAAAIKEQVSAASKDWPKSIVTTSASVSRLVREEGLNREDVYEFWTRTPEAKGTDVVFVQYRVMIDGKKNYVAYSYWSDGKWRRMEPDGWLPFWKPREERTKYIMIHEGAKTARYVTDLIADKKRRSDHPWGERLAQYEHWGLIGGALSPHRADYAELKRASPQEVVYVCDNDWHGKTAIETVSRMYGGKLKGVYFNDSFPPTWDLADPMPASFFKPDENGVVRYRGYPLESFERAATWATASIFDSKVKTIRQEFAEEWRHSVLQDLFVHINYPDLILTATQFDKFVDHFSDVRNTSTLLSKKGAGKAVDIMYSPALPPGIFKSWVGGREAINTHKGPHLKPEKGDPKPFIDFMEHLIPNETDRQHLLRWCFTLIARPEVKMHYGVLLISEPQGVGKTTLGADILKQIVGPANASEPSEADITDSNYNYWAAHKRLAVVNEIYAGQSSKAYDRLKSVITDSSITIHKKYQADYEIQNWLHIFACSNSQRALMLSNDDRRWLIPGVTDDKKSVHWWDRFHSWLKDRGGLAIIMWYADKWIKEHGPVLPGDAAPITQAKRDAIVAGYSQGQLCAADFFAYLKRERDDEPWLIYDREVQNLLVHSVYNGQQSKFLERPLTIRRVAVSEGLYVSKNFIGTRHIRVISNKREIASLARWDYEKHLKLKSEGGLRLDVTDEFKAMEQETEKHTGMKSDTIM